MQKLEVIDSCFFEKPVFKNQLVVGWYFAGLVVQLTPGPLLRHVKHATGFSYFSVVWSLSRVV